MTSNKNLIKTARLFKNPSVVLPILDCALLLEDKIIFCDLENFISIPYKTGISATVPNGQLITVLDNFKKPSFKKKEFSVFISEGKQTVEIFSEDTGNYPAMPAHSEAEMIGDIPESEIADILDASEFTSKDFLRPVMMRIQVWDHIAATDAHRLFFLKKQNPLSSQILLTDKAAKLMGIFQGNWRVKKDKFVVSLTNEEGVIIYFKYDDLNFPSWKDVLPKVTDKTSSAIFDVKEMLAAIKMGSKFGNHSSKQGVISLAEKVCNYSTDDADFSTGYCAEISVNFDKPIEIAFNWDFLSHILGKFKEERTVKMHYFDQKKGAIFGGKYLIMPLMMNK